MSVSRILIAAAIAAMPIAGLAKPKVDPMCADLPGSQQNCVPFVGCFGDAGEYFTGRAIGWGQGAIVATSSTSVQCVGRWTGRNAFGFGEARVECDDGRTGVVLFTYRDSVTGTATGFGKLSDGAAIRAWSGRDIQQFLINDSGDVDTRLECNGAAVPLG